MGEGAEGVWCGAWAQQQQQCRPAPDVLHLTRVECGRAGPATHPALTGGGGLRAGGGGGDHVVRGWAHRWAPPQRRQQLPGEAQASRSQDSGGKSGRWERQVWAGDSRGWRRRWWAAHKQGGRVQWCSSQVHAMQASGQAWWAGSSSNSGSGRFGQVTHVGGGGNGGGLHTSREGGGNGVTVRYRACMPGGLGLGGRVAMQGRGGAGAQ